MDTISETDRNQHTLGTMWTGVRLRFTGCSRPTGTALESVC